MAVVLVLLATSRSYRNTRCFDQNYQSRKITLQVSVLSIECLLAADGVTCIIFLALIAVVAKLKIEKGVCICCKTFHHLKGGLLILSREILQLKYFIDSA